MWQEKHVTWLSKAKFFIWLYNFLTNKISTPIDKGHIFQKSSLHREVEKDFYELYKNSGRWLSISVTDIGTYVRKLIIKLYLLLFLKMYLNIN